VLILKGKSLYSSSSPIYVMGNLERRREESNSSKILSLPKGIIGISFTPDFPKKFLKEV